MLTPGSEAVLERAFFALSSNPQIRIELQATRTTSEIRKSNQRLSLRRAEAVSHGSYAKDCSDAHHHRGHGSARPLAPNTTPEGRAGTDGLSFTCASCLAEGPA